MNIYITGMRGSGKTTLGKALASKLKRPFIDLDEYIEHEQGKKIREIVSFGNWNYFRDLEHLAFKKISKLHNYIIATGGGTCLFKRNMALLKEKDIVILLVCDLNILRKRVALDPNRPPLKGKNQSDELPQLWLERKKKYYKVAKVVLETDKNGVSACIKELILYLND